MIPDNFQKWLDQKGWQLRPYQVKMLQAYKEHQDILLMAPPGAGKTFAAFLPVYLSLINQAPFKGIHTLYISPLRSLAYDISRNICHPIEEINLSIDVGIRTGDTPSYERQKQNRKPPNIFLITPESLALMLSYPKLQENFKTVQTIIIDEIHSFVASKRGDHLSLLLATLSTLAPHAKRIGLSATIKDPPAVAKWLGAPHQAYLIEEKQGVLPDVNILYPGRSLPLAGHFPTPPLIKKIYQTICQHNTNIVFVNTRAQAERLLQSLWSINRQGLPITLHHGSLSKEQRLKVEHAMVKGQLKAIVATSSLELGIDWGHVDMVINVGAPKGVSRLLQRIGRSNHTLERPSQALLVPLNCFEALECEAALQAIAHNALDDAPPHRQGSFDILAQHIMSSACAGPLDPIRFFSEITKAYPYQYVTYGEFESLFNFVVNGGYVLQHYQNFRKLLFEEGKGYQPASSYLEKIHRLNMGTIVGHEKLKVMLVTSKRSTKRKKGKGTLLGEIEEKFILTLKPGDTFYFAGHVLSFLQINGLAAEVSLAAVKDVKVPTFIGSGLPLSTHLSQFLKQVLTTASNNPHLPFYLHRWLQKQQQISRIPDKDAILVELFPHENLSYLTVYTFEGRAINQALGFLLTYRLEALGKHPLGFVTSEYGLSLFCLAPLSPEALSHLWDPDLCWQSYQQWIQEANILKRHFKSTATVAGLIYNKYPGTLKTGKQVLFSTDLIYDVLKKHEPDHIILKTNQREAERQLVDKERLHTFLKNYHNKICYQSCPRITPFAIPIIVQGMTEKLNNPTQDLLLEMHFMQKQANQLYKTQPLIKHP